MGNCCANEERQDNLDFAGETNIKKEKNQLKAGGGSIMEPVDLSEDHFPAQESAEHKGNEQPASELMEKYPDAFQRLGNWTTRDEPLTEECPENGTYFYSTEDSHYTGQFYKKKRHGLGNLYLSNGDIFSGNFVNNEVSGTGRLITADGKLYEGTFDS